MEDSHSLKRPYDAPAAAAGASEYAKSRRPDNDLASFDPERITDLLREDASDTADPDVAVSVLQRLDAMLSDPLAVDAAQHCQALVVELFKPLASPECRVYRRLGHLEALRSVLVRLHPLAAVFLFDRMTKERISTSLIDAAASNFLTGGACFDILNAMYFALDFTNVCTPHEQDRALRVAATTFVQAADCIDTMTSRPPSTRAPAQAPAKAAMTGLVPAREAVKRALVFILSSKESVLAKHPHLISTVGRRLMEQPSLGFAFADDVFDSFEDPDAVNESYLFNAMLRHEQFPQFFRHLVRTISREGKFCAESFTLQRLLLHGHPRIKELGGLGMTVQQAVDELVKDRSPNMTWVLGAFSCLSLLAAGELAVNVCAPVFKAALGPVLTGVANAPQVFFAFVVVVRLAPCIFIDACKQDASLDTMIDELLKLAVLPPGAELVPGVGRIVFTLVRANPTWCDDKAARRELVHALVRKIDATSTDVQWLRSHVGVTTPI